MGLGSWKNEGDVDTSQESNQSACYPSQRVFPVFLFRYTFAAGSPDRVKKYLFPHGEFLHDFIEGGPLPCVINAMAISEDNVMVTGSDDGALTWYDWRSGRGFQREQSIPQPGSLDSEAGIFAATFDRSGLRLITGEADKSIKIWKESSTDYDQ